MELTLAQVYNAVSVAQKFSNMPIPIRLAFKLGVILDKFLPIYSQIEKQRNILIQKYGELKDSSYTLKEENKDVFIKELGSLLEEKINIYFEQIEASLIPEEIKLTVHDAMNISFLIKE